MKNIKTLLLVAFSCATAVAQTGNPTTLSLKQAIEMGLKNRYDLKANEYNVTLANNRITKAKKEWVPEISANANVRYNSQLQGTLIPAGFGGATESVIVALGAKTVSVFGLDLNQPIYRPGLVSDIKIAKVSQQIESENNILSEKNVKSKISKAYYNANLRKQQWRILENAQQRFLNYYKLMQGSYKLGTVLENDLNKAKLDYDNSTLEVEKAKQSYLLAVTQLKYQMNYESTANVVLSDSLITNENTANVALGTINRSEIKILNLQQDNNKIQIQKAKSYALPTVSLFGNLSSQYLYNDFNYGNSKYWNNFNYVGVKLSLPITGNIKNSNTIKEYKFKSEQNDLALQQLKSDINYEVEKATTDLNNAYSNLKSSEANYILSQDIYNNQKLQFEKGSFKYLNLLETERTLSNSENSFLSAVFDYYLSKINLEQATGNYAY